MQTPEQFFALVRAYCAQTTGSTTSGLRTEQHNRDEGGVARSAHRFGLAHDVTYDAPPALEERVELGRRLGIRVIGEGDHDHLQPLEWIP